MIKKLYGKNNIKRKEAEKNGRKNRNRKTVNGKVVGGRRERRKGWGGGWCGSVGMG